MTGTDRDPYPETELTPEGQNPEVAYSRDLESSTNGKKKSQ